METNPFTFLQQLSSFLDIHLQKMFGKHWSIVFHEDSNKTSNFSVLQIIFCGIMISVWLAGVTEGKK